MPLAFTILRNLSILIVGIGVFVFSFFKDNTPIQEFEEFERSITTLRASIVYQHDPVAVNSQLYSLENSLKKIISYKAASREVGEIYQNLNEGNDRKAVELLNILEGKIRRREFIVGSL